MTKVRSVDARRFPDSLVLLFVLIVLAQVATYLLPAGEFEREGLQVVSGSFHPVDANPLPWFSFLTLIPVGLSAAQEIIFFVFIVGGVIAVVRATGAIDALIGACIRNLGSRPHFLVGGMVAVFALGSSTIGMAEEYVAFVPILVAMCLSMKMDAMVAVAIIYVGAGIGYACAALNPFTVLIAQEIAGVQPTSGQTVRWILLLLCAGIGVHHIVSYVRKLERTPEPDLVNETVAAGDTKALELRFLEFKHIFVLLIFVAGVGLFLFGAMFWAWYLAELTAMLLGLALVIAVVSKLNYNLVATAFCRGAAGLTTTALLIGFARTIQVILSEAQVIDTIIYSVAQSINGLPSGVAVLGMLLVQTVCNFFVPSGSGQAFITMPIMAPLADLTGISRQTAVLAYQFGDGFTNMVVPTNAVLMGILGLAQVPYHAWLRFIVPLLGKLYVVAIIVLLMAVEFGY